MNVLAPIPECSAPLDHYATALAHTQQMHSDLQAAHEVIAQLKADLHREQDRCVMLLEERNKYRADAELLRNKLLSICTTVANIGLMTKEAEAVVMTVNERAAVEHPAIDKLEAEFKQGNETP
jgi:hypothetical protein